MNKENITWKRLAEHIDNMSEEEKNSPVVIRGEGQCLFSCRKLIVTEEDMCYNEDYKEEGCYKRSYFDDDSELELDVSLEAGKTYLEI